MEARHRLVPPAAVEEGRPQVAKLKDGGKIGRGAKDGEGGEGGKGGKGGKGGGKGGDAKSELSDAPLPWDRDDPIIRKDNELMLDIPLASKLAFQRLLNVFSVLGRQGVSVTRTRTTHLDHM